MAYFFALNVPCLVWIDRPVIPGSPFTVLFWLIVSVSYRCSVSLVWFQKVFSRMKLDWIKLIGRVYKRLWYIQDGVVASRSWAVTLSLAQYKTEMNQEMPFWPAQRLSYLTHLRLKPTVNHQPLIRTEVKLLLCVGYQQFESQGRLSLS